MRIFLTGCLLVSHVTLVKMAEVTATLELKHIEQIKVFSRLSSLSVSCKITSLRPGTSHAVYTEAKQSE